MGLDISIYQLIKVRKRKKTPSEDDIYKKYGTAISIRRLTEATNPKPKFEGLADSYIFKCTMSMLSYDKMLESLGVPKEELEKWEWHSDISDAEKCEITFKNKETGKFLEIKFRYGETAAFEFQEDWWCLLLQDSSWIGYMRKGANARFYREMKKDPYKIVCSKKVLKQHMERYFNKTSDERYTSPRAAFRNLIYDKFMDHAGMIVDYWY